MSLSSDPLSFSIAPAARTKIRSDAICQLGDPNHHIVYRWMPFLYCTMWVACVTLISAWQRWMPLPPEPGAPTSPFQEPGRAATPKARPGSYATELYPTAAR